MSKIVSYFSSSVSLSFDTMKSVKSLLHNTLTGSSGKRMNREGEGHSKYSVQYLLYQEDDGLHCDTDTFGDALDGNGRFFRDVVERVSETNFNLI